MPDGGRGAGAAAPDPDSERRGVRGRAGGAERARSAGGFRSQPLALKILLIASLAAIAVGVVRCSTELTAVDASISSIGVERALVDLDERTTWAPADSIAARTARLFAEALRQAARVEVRLATPRSRGFDVIARLRVSDAETGIRVAVGIVHAGSGRALFEAEGDGKPEMLEGLLNGLALKAASGLGVARQKGVDDQRPVGGSESG
jgi:hypothetical protein